MEIAKNYLTKKCNICSGLYDIIKDREPCQTSQTTSRYETDSDYVVPVSVTEADVGPRTIVTRSLARKNEKNELLKKIFYNSASRYPLRNRVNLDAEYRPNYYESEDSDVDTRRRSKIKRRRHSVGAVLQRGNYENESIQNNIRYRRHSETLGGTKEVPPLNCDEKISVGESTTNSVIKNKIVCSTCHLKKLLNLANSQLLSSEAKGTAVEIATEKLCHRRKSEPNFFHVQDKPKYNASQKESDVSQCKHLELPSDARTESKKSHRSRSEGDPKNVNESVAKGSYENITGNTADEKGTKKINQRRRSESSASHIKSRERSSEKHTSRIETGKMSNSKHSKDPLDTKKIFHKGNCETSEGGFKNVESENSVVKRSNQNQTENTGEKVATIIIQRQEFKSNVLHIKNGERSAEKHISKIQTNKMSDSKSSEDALDTKKAEPKQNFHERKSNSVEDVFKKVESCEKSVVKSSYENKTENISDEKLPKKINQRRKSASSILQVKTGEKSMENCTSGIETNKASASKHSEDSLDTEKTKSKHISHGTNSKASEDGLQQVKSRRKSVAKSSYENKTENTTNEKLAKKINQRRKSASSIFHVKNGEKSMEKCTSQIEANKTSASKRSEDELDINKTKSTQILHGTNSKASEDGLKKVKGCEKSVVKSSHENKTENTIDEKLIKKIYHRRKSESGILHIKNKEKPTEKCMSQVETNKTSDSKHSKDSLDTKKTEFNKDYHRGTSEDPFKKVEKSVAKSSHGQKTESTADTNKMFHSKHLEKPPDAYQKHTSKIEPNKMPQGKHLENSQLQSKKIVLRRSSSMTSPTRLAEHSHKREKSSDKSTKKLESKHVSRKEHSEREKHEKEKSSSDKITKSENKNDSKYGKQASLEAKKASGSSTSHKYEKTDTRDSRKKLKTHEDSKQRCSEGSSTSRERKENLSADHIERGRLENVKSSHNKQYSESSSRHKSEKSVTESRKRRSDSGSPHSKERKYSKEAKTYSKQEHGQKRDKSSEKLSPELRKISQTRKSEEEMSHVNERDSKKSECKHRESHKCSKVNPKDTPGNKCSHRDKDTIRKGILTVAKNDVACFDGKSSNLLPFKKRVSFGSSSEDTLSPTCKKVADRRKSDSAVLMSSSHDFKTHSPEKMQKMSSHENSLIVSIEKDRLEDSNLNVKKDEQEFSKSDADHNNKPSTTSSGKRRFKLNINTKDMSEVISISSDEDNQSGDGFLTVEDQLKQIFHDSMDNERATKDLINVLSTSSENLSAAFEKSLMSDVVQQCLDSRSSGQATLNQIITVVDNCGKHPMQGLGNAEKESEARNAITESHVTDAAHKENVKTGSNSAQSDMTKMEHYKKRLIQQHEKPTLMVSPVSTTEEEGDSCPPSPTSPTQNNQEKKKEEAVQSKVARKRAVCRSKYRHQNMELFKLGSSIPTSLCKTKEPYNVCTEKNLQLCYQNQNGKKCAENTPKESITESIIHTMEGTKKKDVLWRSISLNNEKAVTKQPNNTSNNVESSLTNSGRHILPAIVPEIPDRRKIKTSNIRESIPGTNEKAILGNIRVESDLIIRKAAPISINKKKSLIKRRKTVTGVEGSETENQGVDDECVPDVFDVPNQVTVKPVSERRKSVSTESELSSTSPINLSLKNQELDMRSAEGSNDPRLYTRRLYLKQILPKQYNTPQKTCASSGQNHESASVAEQSTPSSATSHESPRVYISAPNGPFTPSTQNHESGRNYIAGPSTSVQNQESVQNYVTALNKPPASSHNQEPTRNYGSGLLATEKTYEPVGPMKTPACLFQNPEPSRNYFAAPCITTNAPMPYYPNNYVGPNFPEIQQQMNRLDNPNATLPVQSHVMNARKENADTYRIIKLMKSNMDQSFTIEILLMLTKWCNELRTRSTQQTVSKKIKTSITRTINETILYISDKLFGIPCNQQLKSYAEQIIQFIEPHHKEIFKSLLPIMRVHCGDEQWMNSVIKWLSQSQQAVYASDPRTQVNNHPNPMLSVPSHNFLHPAQNNPPQNHHLIPQNHPYAPQNHPHAPQNYLYQNYRQPSLPFQGYPYQPNSSLQGNYLMNMEQHHRPGMVLSYPPNSLEAAEMQKSQQNIQALYQNGPQNFQGPVSFNVPPQTMVRPEMYLADNRCVPPKYGHNPNPEQVPQHLPEQNRVTRSKKKDRLDIIPKPPAVTTSAIIPASNNNVENPSHKVINNQITDKTRTKQKKTYASRQNRVIGWPNSEASTSSSNGVDYRTGPDVEELLQTSFIYNNGRTGSADTDETTSVATENNSPGLDTSVTDRSVDETTDQNIINANNNTESNQVAQEEANTNSQEDNSNENDRTVGNTVIVKDNSVEITRGNVGDNFDSKESINFIEEVSNDLTLEKVPLAQGTNGAVSTSASADNSLDDKQIINVGVKTELFDITSKMKQALLLYVGDNPDVKFQIIKEVFGSHFNGLEDYLEFLHTKKKEPREILNGNEVILIDSDEDISMEDVLDMPKPIEDPPKLIRIRTKRRDTDGNQGHQGKKLRTRGTLAALNNTDSDIILVDEDIQENIQNNSDFNQNYITIEDDANKNQELLKNPLKEEPNSEIADTNISTDETTAATESMVVTNVDLTASPIANNQPLPTVEAEMPVLEAISDEETEHFRLHSRYEKRISSNTLNTLDSSEVSRCTLINGTINCIEQASRGDLFEKPLVYTKPMTPRRKISNDPARSAKGLDGPVAKRHWGSLASITHFEEDGSSTMSVVNVQPGWDLNYAFPKPRGHYPASPAYLPMESPLTSPRHLEDNGYPRLSPITSPSMRFSPNFRSPNRSVPTSPAGLSPSSAQMPSSVVSATSPIVSAGTPVALGTTAALDNSKVNWQNWFAEEKRKGFFNFDRSQSVESDSASRRQSIETTSSAGSDYLSKVPPENYCEIKIDSKTYRIKRSLYEKIPKGKLCYIRENNTFIRYFDDGQMELFLRNLNMSDGSSIASDLLKQIKGRVEGLSDVDTSLGHYASGKSEVIALSEDVSFSTADKLAVPELYVEEVEKVQRNVPRDFYGFYKYVTGYQIINHHAPISFQTFLTMHNTNGIRGLFKSYVNTLIEGHAVL